MKYDLDILNEYIEKGLIIKQVHATLPLSIYNYSKFNIVNLNESEVSEIIGDNLWVM